MSSARPFCETCGKDVAEVLCPTCAKWWADNPPDLVTVPRAELEAALAPIAKAFDDQVEGRDADWHDLWEHGLSVALTIGEIRAVRDFYFHLKGQP